MDFTSIIGFILGLGLIAYGYSLDGGSMASMVLISAMFIIFGGTGGAVVMSYGFKQLKKLPGLFLETIISPKFNMKKTIDYLVSLSETARKNGLLSLENTISTAESGSKVDPFLKRGILMAVDGTDPDEINDILQNYIYVYEQDKHIGISMLEGAAGYAPTFGMVGTIMGLVQVLKAGMDEPEHMTKAIGIAFVATFYGLMLANLVFIPLSLKLKTRLTLYRLEKEMIIEGVCAIRNGVNPRLLKERLSSYLQLEGKKAMEIAENSSRRG